MICPECAGTLAGHCKHRQCKWVVCVRCKLLGGPYKGGWRWMRRP